MKKYFVTGSYLQNFEVYVYAKNQAEAEELALSGDEDYMMGDCSDWTINDVQIVD